MKQSQRDMTRPAGQRYAPATGALRSKHPVYQDRLPPCNHACPAGENIQAWLARVQEGDYQGAWRQLLRDNPLPAVHGRVCYHPCEQACNRLQVDQPVSIHAVERFLGDMALAAGWSLPVTAPPSGKKVLVVGAGPSGLSCAWHLRHLGHAVEIREAGPMAGGMLRFGIPAYRMPRSVLDSEIARLISCGITLTLNHKVTDILAEKRHGQFDAVFIAIGAHLAKKTDIPAREAGTIMDAVSYLAAVEHGAAPKLGRRVAIYGGGNTAMDAARTARRLGAEEAMIIYRRDIDHMPAHAFEAEEAIEEGVKINWLRTIRHIDNDKVTVEEMTLDETGRPQPTGRFETLEADSLILALGQDVDTEVLTGIPGMRVRDDGAVAVDHQMMTSVAGIFAGGDMVPSERTVTIATGHGKKAAWCIDGWLRATRLAEHDKGPLADYQTLHLWFNTEARAQAQPELAPAQRDGFDEVVGGLDHNAATFEAGRCFSCGNCFECDGCYGACPEDAVIKLGKGLRYEFDYDKCTGCEACYRQCPCHAIEMVAEEEMR